MQNTFAIIIIVIYGCVAFLGGQYVQEHSKPKRECKIEQVESVKEIVKSLFVWGLI